MFVKNFSWSLLFAVAPLFIGNAAKADLPASQMVVFSIHESPSDPNSPVVFTVTLRLEADHADGDSVAWAVNLAVFNRLGAEPRQWSVTSPELVDSVDGFWWIEHKNPLSPEAGEFGVPPRMVGVAAAQDSGYDDLDYDFAGVTPPPTSNQALAQYHFQQVSEPEPEAESEDEEPVDVDGTSV